MEYWSELRNSHTYGNISVFFYLIGYPNVYDIRESIAKSLHTKLVHLSAYGVALSQNYYEVSRSNF